jgi:hypothetical protein
MEPSRVYSPQVPTFQSRPLIRRTPVRQIRQEIYEEPVQYEEEILVQYEDQNYSPNYRHYPPYEQSPRIPVQSRHSIVHGDGYRNIGRPDIRHTPSYQLPGKHVQRRIPNSEPKKRLMTNSARGYTEAFPHSTRKPSRRMNVPNNAVYKSRVEYEAFEGYEDDGPIYENEISRPRNPSRLAIEMLESQDIEVPKNPKMSVKKSQKHSAKDKKSQLKSTETVPLRQRLGMTGPVSKKNLLVENDSTSESESVEIPTEEESETPIVEPKTTKKVSKIRDSSSSSSGGKSKQKNSKKQKATNRNEEEPTIGASDVSKTAKRTKDRNVIERIESNTESQIEDKIDYKSVNSKSKNEKVDQQSEQLILASDVSEDENVSPILKRTLIGNDDNVPFGKISVDSCSSSSVESSKANKSKMVPIIEEKEPLPLVKEEGKKAASPVSVNNNLEDYKEMSWNGTKNSLNSHEPANIAQIESEIPNTEEIFDFRMEDSFANINDEPFYSTIEDESKEKSISLNETNNQKIPSKNIELPSPNLSSDDESVEIKKKDDYESNTDSEKIETVQKEFSKPKLTKKVICNQYSDRVPNQRQGRLLKKRWYIRMRCKDMIHLKMMVIAEASELAFSPLLIGKMKRLFTLDVNQWVDQ